MRDKSCWNCAFRIDRRSDSFFGDCYWFPYYNKGDKKPIPTSKLSETEQTGCKQFESIGNKVLRGAVEALYNRTKGQQELL